MNGLHTSIKLLSSIDSADMLWDSEVEHQGISDWRTECPDLLQIDGDGCAGLLY